MAKNLGSVDSVNSIMKTNSIIVEVGGSPRRITLENFTKSIQSGDLNLALYAWGVPLKQKIQSSPNWGRIGNTAMFEQYEEQCGLYQLTNAGLMAKLSKTNKNKFADGTTVTQSKGHIMFWGPRLYYLVKDDAQAGYPVLWMSTLPIGGHYIEAPCIGAYMGGNVGDILVSRSGLSVDNNKQIRTFWANARKNGKDFGLMNYDHIRYLNMLNLSKFGNTNVQVNVGYGPCGDGNTWGKTNAIKTGATNSLGDKCGKIDISATAGNSKACHTNFFGIENLWGWYWQMIQGVYFGISKNTGQTGSEAFLYEGNYLPTDAELSTKPSSDYRVVQRATSGGYTKNMTLGEYFDIIPSVVGGDSNSYWCDNYWVDAAAGQLFLFGGRAWYGAHCGLGCVSGDDAFSLANGSYGARLAYFGTPKFTDGANL